MPDPVFLARFQAHWTCAIRSFLSHSVTSFYLRYIDVESFAYIFPNKTDKTTVKPKILNDIINFISKAVYLFFSSN